jgi:hypothetical protein
MGFALRFGVLVVAVGLAAPASAGLADLSPPKTPFDQMAPPPTPDYSRLTAWAVWPGVASKADVVPLSAEPNRAHLPTTDVFFIHPTTYLGNETWNAPHDVAGFTGQQLNETVLGYQVSIFNACCRMFAPRYRQATISAFLRPGESNFKAYDLAYSDVLRAFDHHVENENKGRPFILASHSQGSLHATRLIQDRILARPELRRLLVVAYVVGASIPETGKAAGLPVCNSPRQTGCLVDWNSASRLTPLALGRGLMVTWSQGKYRPVGPDRWLCVNPLTWDRVGTASASVMCGRRPRVKGFLAISLRSGASHVSGLFARRTWPLALM